ncbi:tRNA lysidine(34) synthetase TilS [Tamlana sp. 2201CG12-4]|uniref:tRNA lysidine(34) synthetase TilS n=1 Tax=Tamlana sp. 2201CG12-4 TaxID=3112582 RepID=UPI002DB83DFC|nr:tRNA lysidine(34) synthetase TilS [Tamlana sp. 2201CG12-4]MEC3907751.1 tRNA lysidine(34) synthetase TilS [Tamlana sp. 2201CG12-4]
MLNHFKNHIEDQLEFLNQSKLLIAISGGVDSVVLTHLCYQLKLNIALAHCNFNLRGKESDADEDSVLQLAEDLELEVFIQRFDTDQYAKAHKRSIQMAARELRYNWFEELSEQLGFDYVLTAHHADDNLETFLINFTRGTGLDGLTGIPRVNGKFVRPLLPFSSDVIKTYAKENTIKWRDDSSNKSVKYLRNKLRHEVIPILKEINPSLLQSFQATLNHLNDSSSIVNDRMNSFLTNTAVNIKDDEVKFKISEFKEVRQPKAYLFEALKAFGFTEWDDVLNLLDAQSGKQVFSNTHRLIKDRDSLLLSPISTESHQEILVSEGDIQKETPLGVLFFEEVNEEVKQAVNCIHVDKALLRFPLILRQKREGDVFYPIGMSGKKKLSKYFKDEKLSLLDKERTWLLCSGNDIIWVVNRRADRRFKVTKSTETILKIELKP